ncbi:hypothetical protein [uncultured Eubacterium sp.]|uniref:hypothetical protein n=1 Tax=uncultured Eubacterium sp. TaxID=165185 RepID=UPI002629986E|nr:hypothetical protein [uncultured Eubacterium sp.]
MTERQKELLKEYEIEGKKAEYDKCAKDLNIIINSFIENGFTREEAISIICCVGSSK